MNRLTLPTARTVAALVAALAILASSADAQVRRGRAQPVTPGWAPIAVGFRAGWEQDRVANGSMLGGELRIPVIRSGKVEIVPSADMIWLQNTKEYQYNADVLFVPQGPRGGVFLGGGVGWRDSLWGAVSAEEPSRKTFLGYNLVIGGRTAIGPLQLTVTLRRIFLDGSDYSPTALTLGLSYPLWRATPPPRR
jgi:hypothetical protein